MPPLSHLTSFTPTKSNLFLANSLAAAVREPNLYRFLTFQVPNLMSLFYCLGCTKVSVQVWCFLFERVLHDTFLRWGVASTLPNLQAGGPPLVGCLQLLIQYIHSYPPYWRLFLHPQHEGVACRGDRDPLITALYCLDVTYSDYHLFCLLKSTSRGRWFTTNQAVKGVVHAWLVTQFIYIYIYMYI